MTVTTIKIKQTQEEKQSFKAEKRESFTQHIIESWEVIAPFWPLKNLIAVNPLKGLEDLPIEDALVKGSAYFEQTDLPKPMDEINRETIKWLQAYFDEGQATISMPFRILGLYSAWKQLAIYDGCLHRNDIQKIKWLRSLSDSPKEALAHCLFLLKIPKEQTGKFLKLLLTSMPGWASYIKYRTDWAEKDTKNSHQVTQIEYLAMRAIITYLLWPKASELLIWSEQALEASKIKKSPLIKIKQFEENYRLPLLKKLIGQPIEEARIPSAQLVFCIDVRSEPLRRALEASGDYETFGFAGFFGIPVQITDSITGESHASCPVLLSPKHEVKECPCSLNSKSEYHRNGYERLVGIKKLYQSIKYTFTTPFAMVESLGIISGAWMGLCTFTPNLASKLKKIMKGLIRKPIVLTPSLSDIPFENQYEYAEGALKMMGLTHHFAPLIVFCGHGSSTQNNAYASALDCGACGGQHGLSNARILTTILNQPIIRRRLAKQGITIPDSTLFIAAEHNTTTDEVMLYNTEDSDATVRLKQDLEKARQVNTALRLSKMQQSSTSDFSAKYDTLYRSQDWAEVRPEWGLARNAAFIVAPRNLTRSLDLEGRCFLHSYDYTQDLNGKSLETILTAPMVVAQWINAQYLFSTLDNVSYGGGSKITKNITGKIGIMQGNASDLMTGLPLQSVFSNDNQFYHEPQRLLTIVYAPRSKLEVIIQAQPTLQKLFGNGWVQLACVQPESRIIFLLKRDLTWKKIH